MTRASRWLPRLAVLVGVVLFTALSRHLVTGAVFALLVVASGLPRKGFELDRIGQLIVALAGAVGAWLINLALVSDLGPLGPLGTIATLISLMIVVPRLWLASPWLGERGTAFWSTLVVLGCGDSRAGPLYPAAVCLFLALELAALRAADPGRLPWARLGVRHRLFSFAVLGLAAGIGLAVALSLPPAHDWAMGRIYEAWGEARSGFSVNMRLGSLSRMLQSDEVVLRVHGPRPDHLRGYVYTEYSRGNWRARGVESKSVELGAAWVEDGGQTRVDAVGGESSRYFLPMGARRVGVDEGRATGDRFGVLKTVLGHEAERIWFELGARDAASVAPPDEGDLAVPEEVAGQLGEIARRWTAGRDDPAGKLEAIGERFFEEYAYSLSFERNPHVDPVLDFLTRGKTGHCEYFASATALLARTLGIPARVVGGYRVSERNPLGGYHLVRKLHAHAWVEAWTGDGGWHTVDTTPAAEVPAMTPGETSFAAALFDVISVGFGSLVERVRQMTWKHVLGFTAALLVLWVVVRLVRRRRQGAVAVEERRFGEPLPCLARLLDALGRRGVERVPGETLERLARRVAREPGWAGFGGEASRLLESYAAHRYGGVGRESEVAEEIDRFVAGDGSS